MNIIKKIKKIISDACVYFTAAIFAVIGIATVFLKLAPEQGSMVDKFLGLGSAALIFLACLIMSALNLVWRLDYSLAVRTLIHFIGAFVSYALIFIVIPGVYTNTAQVAVRSIVFVILYLLIAFVVFLAGSIKRNRRSDDMEYESQFGNFLDKN